MPYWDHKSIRRNSLRLIFFGRFAPSLTYSRLVYSNLSPATAKVEIIQLIRYIHKFAA